MLYSYAATGIKFSLAFMKSGQLSDNQTFWTRILKCVHTIFSLFRKFRDHRFHKLHFIWEILGNRPNNCYQWWNSVGVNAGFTGNKKLYLHCCMTRIKKRRSGKKRTRDQKKKSAGRRGRVTSNAVKAEEKIIKKQTAAKTAGNGPSSEGKPATAATGKTRSAGARRIAVSKSIVGSAKPSKVPSKIRAAAKKIADSKAGKPKRHEEGTKTFKTKTGFRPRGKKKSA